MDNFMKFIMDEASPKWLKINKIVLLISDISLILCSIVYAFLIALWAESGFGFFIFNGMVVLFTAVIFMGHAWWMLVFNVIYNIQSIKDNMCEKIPEQTLPEF